MKSICLIFALCAFATQNLHASVLRYDFDYVMVSETFEAENDRTMKGYFLVDTEEEILKAFKFSMHDFLTDTQLFQSAWTGETALLTSYWYGAPIGVYFTELHSITFENNDSFFVTWEYHAPNSENPLDYIHQSGDGPQGTYTSASGDRWFVLERSISSPTKVNVPEPSTLALLGLGLAGLGLRRRQSA